MGDSDAWRTLLATTEYRERERPAPHPRLESSGERVVTTI
jgi:hypothetical protein